MLWVAAAVGAPVDDAWQEIVAMDAGPTNRGTTQEEARSAAQAHLGRQERALRGFLEAHGRDARAFEARLRLARLLQIRAQFEKNSALRKEGEQMLEAAARIATPEQRAEVDFARVTAQMRSLQPGRPEQREALLSVVRKFQAAHPADRRVPPLLAEVATLFDEQPRAKRALLQDAQTLTQDAALRKRVADDLKRLDLLGAPVPLSFTALDGAKIDLTAYRGKTVIVVFFADWSPPSVTALGEVKKAAEAYPRSRVQVLGVSLDEKQEELDALLKEHAIDWPIAFDGKGWKGDLVRSLGINTLPTVWLFDPAGNLRALNARTGLPIALRQLTTGR